MIQPTEPGPGDTPDMFGMPVSGVDAQSREAFDAPLLEAEVRNLLFPCNREDALYLLSGLAFTKDFPISHARLALLGDVPAVLVDGLRAIEAELLSGGNDRSFPVLFELLPGARAIISVDRISRFHCRTQEEADAFRLRPVEEVDPGSFECVCTPALFNLPGEARFSIRVTPSPEEICSSSMIDRLSAGYLQVFELIRRNPACSQPVAELCGAVNVTGGAQDLAWLVRAMDPEHHAQAPRHVQAIVNAFLHAERQDPRSMISHIGSVLRQTPPPSDEEQHIDDAWLDFASRVASNQIALDGRLLGDQGAIFLRAGLLAALSDNVEAINSFMQGVPPAGPRVASAASFLIGIRRGLLDESWRFKSLDLQLGGRITAALLRKRNQDIFPETRLFSVESVRTEQGAHFELHVLGQSVGSWDESIDAVQTPSPDAPELQSDADHAPTAPTADEVLDLGEGVTVLMARRTDARGLAHFQLRQILTDADKLAKKAAIIEHNNIEGVFWRLNVPTQGIPFLSCDILAVPDEPSRSLLLDRLRAARAACLTPSASKPARSAVTRRKKTSV